MLDIILPGPQQALRSLWCWAKSWGCQPCSDWTIETQDAQKPGPMGHVGTRRPNSPIFLGLSCFSAGSPTSQETLHPGKRGELLAPCFGARILAKLRGAFPSDDSDRRPGVYPRQIASSGGDHDRFRSLGEADEDVEK